MVPQDNRLLGKGDLSYANLATCIFEVKHSMTNDLIFLFLKLWGAYAIAS